MFFSVFGKGSKKMEEGKNRCWEELKDLMESLAQNKKIVVQEDLYTN